MGLCISDVTFLDYPTAERAVTPYAWDPIIYNNEPSSPQKSTGGKSQISTHGLIHRYGSELCKSEIPSKFTPARMLAVLFGAVTRVSMVT